MSMEMPKTPMLDQLESGPWPSFVSGLKRLAQSEDKSYAPMMKDLLGQLERSYQTRKGYWKGGTIGVVGYGAGVIPRFSELKDEFPASAEFHTLRIMPPAGMHYTAEILSQLCDIWEKYGSGLIALHGQSGDIMFQGIRSENVQPCFDEMNELGFDLGGAGAGVRTSISCVGAARCEHSCFDEARAMRMLVNAFLDEMHRPSLPYKFKFKVSGCANDCANAIQRSDFAVIGTWRDEIQADQDEIRRIVARRGRKWLIDQVITLCPSHALSLNDDDSLDIANHDCVRCMHCINVLTKALSPGRVRGATVLIGGKRTLKIGDLMGSVVAPFLRLESDEDYEALLDLARRVMDFFIDNALEHERTGEMIERIGLVNFLEGIGLEVDPNMIRHPRTNSYVRTDGWDEEAAKWKARHGAAE
ncbi:dissimilatory-type sulfite reductase subunit alpha [Magnetospirillum fulvum]|uniref:Dissimilatory sulfite reductase alpha subunit n=1 Tax=Magnetospirillum fulvum TaxID=1082 RepID=A0A1H6HWR9_MAGFU|nr:dissimilatory-type sulfite reductase subunit alpha [Magnetospirillum fulvum]SEH40624.1 dissimilatory sulfite reductase alpha subunit [Magnetospirillum fulvum]